MKLNAKSPSAAGIVAGAAFIASAGHIVSVVSETNPIWFALAYPIGIDGLIYVGIRSLQEKRFLSGTIALLIGAVYSLAFNAHAEGALVMPALMIASSMPVAMFAAFLIEAFGAKDADIEAPAAAPQIITKTVAPALLPIAPFAPKPVAAPKVIAVASPAGRTVFVKADVAKTDAPKTSGRKATWDVEKTVGLIEDGRTDADVLGTVDGLTAKPLQRTKRAVRLLTEDASQTDAEIASTVGQSAAHIARVRAAMKG
jgi:hypothetical protein